MKMIYGVACLDRADPLDGQESRQERALAKLKLKTPLSHPLLSRGCLGCSQPHCCSLQNQRVCAYTEKRPDFTVKTFHNGRGAWMPSLSYSFVWGRPLRGN